MFRRMLYCAASDPDEAGRGRLLNGLLLSFTLLTLLTFVAYSVISGAPQTALEDPVTAVLLLALYWLSRRGIVMPAAAGTIVLIMALVLVVSLVTPAGGGPLSLGLVPITLLIPIVLAGALISWRAVPPVTLVAFALLDWLYTAGLPGIANYQRTYPGDTATILLTVGVLFLAVAALTMFVTYQTQTALSQLRQQNAALAIQGQREGAWLGLMRRTAGHISTSVTEISGVATQQVADSQQQATALSEVTNTVEELNQAAVQIATAAAAVTTAAEQTLISAGRGQEAVRDSIIGMALIRSRVNEITTRILALSKQSQRISDIIDVIDEMAARTHILALNAAVESAGAGGEAGERFGVVASEVKKLAQHSAAATREVRVVIAQVQAATNAAVMATEDGLKETEKGVQVAHRSGDANEDIIQMVERTVQLANAISLATQQQQTASAQVVATMREMVDLIYRTQASSRETLDAVSHLGQAAQSLAATPENAPGDPPSLDAGTPPAANLRLDMQPAAGS